MALVITSSLYKTHARNTQHTHKMRTGTHNTQHTHIHAHMYIYTYAYTRILTYTYKQIYMHTNRKPCTYLDTHKPAPVFSLLSKL